MQSDTAPYFTLLGLAGEWAAESQTPPQMVLRALCDWSVAGGFPEGSFLDPTGSTICPLDIFMSFRAVIETSLLNNGITVGDMTVHTRDQWGEGLLSRVLVTSAGVLSFCEQTDTLPPPSLLSGFRRWWVTVKDDRSLAPPMCPDAEKYVIKAFARSYAAGFLGTLEEILRGLKGGHRRIGYQSVEEGPINFEFWGARWRSSADNARHEIGKCGDRELLSRLEALESQWSSFVDANSADPAEPAQSAITKSATPERSVGRPVGSGSFTALDVPLLEEMRKAIAKDASLSPTAAARQLVDRAAGGGTEDSKIKRLALRYYERFGTTAVPNGAE